VKKVKWGWRPSLWASWRPFGVGLQRPNNYRELWRAFRENKGRRKYAWRILKRGVCDGCALGTTGMRDWTQSGVHLCNIRLRLLRLNTAPPFDPALLADVSALTEESSRALRELGRLPAPMIRRRGEPGFTVVSWDAALTAISEQIRASTPDRLGFYLTSRGIPNETYYVAQKAVRALGTNAIDNAARICHSPSTTALKAGLGVAATTCSYSDWIGTDLVVFFGSNVANNQPVATKYLYLARKAGTRVAVVNSYREPGMERYWIPSTPDSALFGTKIATDFFIVGVGGDIAFVTGAIKHIFAAGLANRDFIAGHTTGVEALEAAVAAAAWADLELLSGASRAEMEAFGALVGGAERAVFVWSMGITQHVHGEDGVRAIIDLALTRGFVGHEGSGLMPIRGHSGVQGGAEMGAYTTVLPGGRAITPENAADLGASYGFEVPTAPGLTAPEMIDRAASGDLDVLYSVGGNWLEVLPDPAWVAAALARVPLRVHQDIVLSSQMLVEPADTVVLLPAATRYEIPGGVTQTTTERRIIFSPEIPGPRVPEARPEWEVFLDVARRVRPDLADRLTFADTAAIRAEIARVVPFYAGVEGLARQGDQLQYGGAHLCAGWRFPTPDGRARFGAVPVPPRVAPEGTFLVATRRGKQFNSMIHERTDALNGVEREAVLMDAGDAARLGVGSGDAVTLHNEVGRLRGRVVVAPVAPGSLQVHWPEGNVLIRRGRRSPDAGIPDYTAWVSVTAETP
jgi:molybdopterin-dependent oxidoreductase alpha subunit